MVRIESLLSARLFVAPQMKGDRLFFISNLGGHNSLYAMNYGGSVPEPLLPPHIALQNPHLIGGAPFYVFPKLNQILVMIDRDGDENYQPMLIPLEGGYPEAAFNGFFADYRVHLTACDPDHNMIYLAAESRQEQRVDAYRGNLESGELVKLASSPWGVYPYTHTPDHNLAVMAESYSMGDDVIYLWDEGEGSSKVLYGIPMADRQPGQEIPLLGLIAGDMSPSHQGLVLVSARFTDTYSPGYMAFDNPEEIQPVSVQGEVHSGTGEMVGLHHLQEDHYLVSYNIDGVSWVYEGRFNEQALTLTLENVIVGQGELAEGKLDEIFYDKECDRFVASFSTATSPTQIYTIEGKDRKQVTLHTAERILGIPQEWMSPGEDASFTSFDGTRVSARLYLPSPASGFEGPRPVVYYVHGGPQGQERPDFAWFSMPLIQFLTLNGFAVFVPNVRGSTGYGLSYTKQVDRDWGGKDRLDHVHAMTEVLPKDKRLDASRAGVVGRSYGGYMTLTLAGRHPELWSAAVDMFGPYDLITFMERIPETWKPYFEIVLGNPEKDKDFLLDRSPRTHIHQLECPMLVIQGKNDPRVVEAESRDLVEGLRAQGKDVEYLMFENEGHDVLKFENRVTCYNAITDFFRKTLKP